MQRRYTSYLIAISLAPSSLLEIIGFPGDTAPLARFELRKLNDRLVQNLHSGRADVTTQAHLEDIHNRVARALNPTAIGND